MTTTPRITPSRARRRVEFAAALGLVLAAAALGGSAVWVARGAEGHIRAPQEVQFHDVALVLGAQVGPDGRPSSFLAARLDLAYDLYRAGVVRVLLVSGGGPGPAAGTDEPAAMRDYLLRRGVPAERIVLDPLGRDTYHSCARAHRVFGVDRLVVLTQSYHLPRALAICRALGIEAVGVGDESARRQQNRWRAGRAREVFANVKALLDVTVRRDPQLGPPQSDVRDALARS